MKQFSAVDVYWNRTTAPLEYECPFEYEIVELEEYSGEKARVYSVILRGDNSSLFESFVKNFSPNYPQEVSKIEIRLELMGNQLGAREIYFKEEADGKFQGRIAKKYFVRIMDAGIGTLRVYCLRFGNDALILFDGGIKPNKVTKWQDDPKLMPIVERAMKIARCITSKIDAREIQWKGNLLIGDLKNYDEYENE